eukprot:882333-Pleurochrysis_carterae.AAC.1
MGGEESERERAGVRGSERRGRQRQHIKFRMEKWAGSQSRLDQASCRPRDMVRSSRGARRGGARSLCGICAC